jgi:hypothetical protein
MITEPKPHLSLTRQMVHPQQRTLRLSSAMVSCARRSERGANDSKHRSLGYPPEGADNSNEALRMDFDNYLSYWIAAIRDGRTDRSHEF